MRSPTGQTVAAAGGKPGVFNAYGNADAAATNITSSRCHQSIIITDWRRQLQQQGKMRRNGFPPELPPSAITPCPGASRAVLECFKAEGKIPKHAATDVDFQQLRQSYLILLTPISFTLCPLPLPDTLSGIRGRLFKKMNFSNCRSRGSPPQDDNCKHH